MNFFYHLFIWIRTKILGILGIYYHLLFQVRYKAYRKKVYDFLIT